MKKILLGLLIALPLCSFAQQSEWSIQMKNGVLLNKGDASQRFGDVQYAEVRNTLQQSLGAQYTRVTKYGLLLSGGLDVGYERYYTDIRFPFAEFGYRETSAALTDKYKLQATIPNIELNLNIGYRATIKNVMPEIRVGQVLHMPLANKYLNNSFIERTVFGYYNYTTSISGSYGNVSDEFVAELLNYVYLGCSIKSSNEVVNRFRVGLQFQKQLIFKDNPLNHYRITYMDAIGSERSIEQFDGSHKSVTLVVNYTF